MSSPFVSIDPSTIMSPESLLEFVEYFPEDPDLGGLLDAFPDEFPLV